MKILVGYISEKNNLGGPSILESFLAVTKKNFPNAKIDLFIAKMDSDSLNYITSLGMGYLEYSDLFWKKNAFFLLKSILYGKNMKAVQEKRAMGEVVEKMCTYDVFVDLSGICFTDKIAPKNIFTAIYDKIQWILAKRLGLRVVKYTTSIGPIHSLRTRWSAKFLLKHFCDYLILREYGCEKALVELNTHINYEFSPDVAFMLEKSDKESLKKLESINLSKGLIGISISFQLANKVPNYFQTMTTVCNFFLESGFGLVLIANECSGRKGTDDKMLIDDMVQGLSNKNYTIIDSVELRSREIKSYISECDYIITSRYHTLIAAISQNIPTIALSWHLKYREALELVDAGEYVLENEKITPDNILALFEKMMHDKNSIERKMQKNNQLIKSQILLTNRKCFTDDKCINDKM